MRRFGSEIAANAEQRTDARRLSARVFLSLALAITAYLGLLAGGNLIIGPAGAANNALSAPAKETQPQQLTAREAVRGLLAADRKIAPKQTLHDLGPASISPAPYLDFAEWAAPAVRLTADIALRPAVSAANQPRAPPAV